MPLDSRGSLRLSERIAIFYTITGYLTVSALIAWGIGHLFPDFPDVVTTFRTAFIFLLLVTIGLFIWSRVLVSQSKALKKEEAKKAENDRAARQLEDQRRGMVQSLQMVNDRATGLTTTLPNLLKSVEHNLDDAQREFKRGAFSPFWEAIEIATLRLGEVSDELQAFQELTIQHKSLAGQLRREYSLEAAQFPVKLRDVYSAEEAQKQSLRMDALVSQAHTIPQFATIYEQRRTSAILIAGFSNLGNAIAGMTARITGQLEGVVKSIDGMSSQVTGQLDGVAKSIDSAATTSHAQSAEALRMLDNIQRRRLPLGTTRTDY